MAQMSVAPPRPRPTSGGKTTPSGLKSQPTGRGTADAAPKVTVGFTAAGQADERILFVTQVLIGYKVEVQVSVIV